MRRIATLIGGLALLFALAGAALPAPEMRQLVLVSGSGTRLPPLTTAEIRRLFLGIPIYKDGVRLEPMHNVSDPLLYEVFLQKTLYMSAQNYERQLLNQVFQAGGSRPVRYTDAGELVGALQAKPGAVTFMWKSNADKLSGVKVIQALWQGPVE